MKKRIFALLLALLLSLSLFACAVPEPGDADGTASTPGAVENQGENRDDPSQLNEEGSYSSKKDVAEYLWVYGRLPNNYMTKKEARALGWEGGSLEPYAPGCYIGGDRFGNYEGLLPQDADYTECDIPTKGAEGRGAQRIVFSDTGYIYYTDDHYESFSILWFTDEMELQEEPWE